MDVEEAGESKEAEAKDGEKDAKDEAGDADQKDKKDEKKKEPEPTEEILRNPCRVLTGQTQYISFPAETPDGPVRYRPLLKNRCAGFLLLTDTRPEEPEELFLADDKPCDDDKDGGKEPEAPEPFEWEDDGK